MPEFLFHQLQRSNHSDTLERHAVFQQWEYELRGCFSVLMPLLRPLSLDQGAIVFKAGQRISCMYFVEKGECDDVDSGSKFGVGSHFASECLFIPTKTRFTMAKTVTVTSAVCHLLTLDRREFNKQLHIYCPLLLRKMRQTLVDEQDENSSWVRLIKTVVSAES